MLVHYEVMIAPVRSSTGSLTFLVRPRGPNQEELIVAELRDNYVVTRNRVTRVESLHATCEELQGSAVAIFRPHLTSPTIGTLTLHVPTTE